MTPANPNEPNVWVRYTGAPGFYVLLYGSLVVGFAYGIYRIIKDNL